MRKDRGFTLIEVLVSLTLLALMAVALFGSLRMAINAWSKGEEKIGESVKFRVAFDRIKRQIACIYPVMMMSERGEVRGQLVPYLRGTRDQIEFVSLSALNFQENPGLTIISYHIKEMNGKRYLVENERPYLGTDSLKEGFSPISFIPHGIEIPLLEGAEEVQFRYFEKIDDGTGNPISEWVDEWDSELKRDMPVAVEMKVVQNNGNQKTFQLRENRLVVELLAKPLWPTARYMMRRQQQFRPGVQTPGVIGPGGRARRLGPGGRVGPELPPPPPPPPPRPNLPRPRPR